MSLKSQPGYNPRDLISVIPITAIYDPDGGGPAWERKGSELKVIPRKLTSAQGFRTYGQQQDVAYALYADHKPYTTFPLSEKDKIWHPEVSTKHDDGTPNFDTALDINSIVPSNRDGVAQIDVSGSY